MADRPHPTAPLAAVVAPTSGTGPKQLYFAGLVLGYTLLVAMSALEMVVQPQFLAALGLIAVTTVLALTVRWDSRPLAWAALIPLLDIAGVALIRDLMRDVSMSASLLALIPVMWLSGRLRRTGVLISLVAVTLAITVPSLVRGGELDSMILAHALLLPLTVLQIGLLTEGALGLLDRRNERLQETVAERETVIDEIDASAQLLQSILDTVDVGIVVVDADGHDVLMNARQRRIHALAIPPDNPDPNEAELLLRYPGTALPIPAEERPVRRAVLQESFSNYLVAMGPLGEDGTAFSASARQILDRNGERAGAVVVFSDVTSYLEMVRSQEQFVASVSHELRTPLTSVIGYLELSRDDLDLSKETASYLQVAQRNAEQLLVIVEDLLQDQVSRSGAEKLVLRPARLSDIAAESADAFALRAQEAGITLVRELRETAERPLDAARMRQAVDNLLSNAVKYTRRGGTVTVATEMLEGHAELRVTDTGIGMTAQEQTNLFTDFYRTETARNSDIPGHGIGLSLTRRIVVSHNGQISVRSQPGEGSTFWIRLAAE
ncbi:sensor histidine kinase [Brachybacterium sp. J153]|uniref:sensor histidine kinase n=1 Tax=Brachybacterium sp. J153 TaxID=3116488 RepID=UPI002E7A0CBE|nr:ATP-binding protein [Brachybacterium sp. J153]MEE1617860.1 ATP-binding protein [Brachybacterium sp. J153]